MNTEIWKDIPEYEGILVSKGSICLCCKGRRNHSKAGGFKWEYA